MNNYNKLRVVLIILMTISIVLGAYMALKDSKQKSEEEEEKNNNDITVNFYEEYPMIPKDDIFKSISLKEANKLLENESGYFFFCNIENFNCTKYAMYLHDEAEDQDLKTIYYIDIKEDMEKETTEYKKLKELTKDKLDKIEYPLSIVVNKKKIIGVNKVTDDSFWTDENIDKFRVEIMLYMNEIS